jgi:hypothetical protein
MCHRQWRKFKTKAALAEWANDQTMPEIAAYYNGLPNVKPVKKFESREVAVTRIWAVLRPDKPKVARNLRRPTRRPRRGGNSPRLREPEPRCVGVQLDDVRDRGRLPRCDSPCV